MIPLLKPSYLLLVESIALDKSDLKRADVIYLKLLDRYKDNMFGYIIKEIDSDPLSTFDFDIKPISSAGIAKMETTIPSIIGNYEIEINTSHKLDKSTIIHEIIHIFNGIRWFNKHTLNIIMRLKKKLLLNNITLNDAFIIKRHENESLINEIDDQFFNGDKPIYPFFKKAFLALLDSYDKWDKTDPYYNKRWFMAISDIWDTEIRSLNNANEHIEKLKKFPIKLLFTISFQEHIYYIKKYYKPAKPTNTLKTDKPLDYTKSYYEHSTELDTRFKERLSYLGIIKRGFRIFETDLSFDHLWEAFYKSLHNNKYVPSEELIKLYKKKLWTHYNEKTELSEQWKQLVDFFRFIKLNFQINNITLIEPNIYSIIIKIDKDCLEIQILARAHNNIVIKLLSDNEVLNILEWKESENPDLIEFFINNYNKTDI